MIRALDGDTLRYQGRYLYSSRYPQRQALSRFPSILSPNTLYVVVSPLLHYGLFEFVSQVPDNSAIICLELDATLAQFHRSYRLKETLNFRYLETMDSYLVEHWLKDWEFLALKTLVVIYASAGHQHLLANYTQFMDSIKVLVEQQHKNAQMLQRVHRRWLRNCIKQLASAPVTYTTLPRMERPIVVVGAGLTLEYARDWLAERAGSYYVIAVDTALPALMAYGITPDLMICLEASVINLLDFIGVYYPDVPMLCDLSAHPQTKRLHAGETFFTLSDFSHASFYQRIREVFGLPSLIAGGSVGITAITLALQMSDQPIILCGIDFAFTLGKSHARGSYTHAMQLAGYHRLVGIPLLQATLERPLVKVQGVQDHLLDSDVVMQSYAQMLIHSTTKRIFTLNSPYAMAMGLPLWNDEISPMFAESKPKITWSSTAVHRAVHRAWCKREMTFLEQFINGDLSCWQELSYLFVGEEYSREIAQSSQAKRRAIEVLGWWQASMASSK
ncbi:DUF115 domain-containing protein [Entomospira culicis]|nr:DUF115 domain-containing protein [Entomospira culicis]